MDNSEIDNFMETALVCWVKTFIDDPISYQDLTDGVYLNDVFSQIDTSSCSQQIKRNVTDISARIQNWQNLIHNIKNFYRDVLQQLLIVRLPDILVITREPDSETALTEIILVLKLLLGCAVQCARKEEFVEVIKGLSEGVQVELVGYIQEVTDPSSGYILDSDPPDDLDDNSQAKLNYFNSLIKERDDYAENLVEMTQELEFYRKLVDKQNNITSTPGHGHSLERNPQIGELTICRKKIKNMEEDMEDRNKLVTDLHDDIKDRDVSIARLKSDNIKLREEIKYFGITKDDLDILREQASECDKYEKEVFTLKQKVAEINFYKNLVQELREDNSNLVESRTRIEELLERSRQKEETVIDDLVKCQIQYDELKMVREHDVKKIEKLQDDFNNVLEEKKRLAKQLSSRNNKSLQSLNDIPGRGQSLSEELQNDKLMAELGQLTLENKELQRLLKEAKDKQSTEDRFKIMDLKKEKQKLQLEIRSVNEKLSHEKQRNEEVMTHNSELHYKQERHDAEISLLKDQQEVQLEEFQNNLKELKESAVMLRSRADVGQDDYVKEVEQENVSMFQSVQDLTAQMNRLKYANRVLRKSCDKLKDDIDSSHMYSEEVARLKRNNYELQKELAANNLSTEMSKVYDKKNLKLEIENKKLKRLVDILKTTISQVDPMNRISYYYITSV